VGGQAAAEGVPADRADRAEVAFHRVDVAVGGGELGGGEGGDERGVGEDVQGAGGALEADGQLAGRVVAERVGVQAGDVVHLDALDGEVFAVDGDHVELGEAAVTPPRA
jgi:hypothetical protein